MNNKLTNFQLPEDLKQLSEHELGLLSYDIRDFLIEHISKTGGHLASNLGVVELSVALHKVFDSPTDKIVWDVGHQSYVHKILTGRADGFDDLRKLGGMSGFPKREESPHDISNTGHSSNSISIAMGLAAARDMQGEDYSVVAVIGDGALTGGVAYEALNNAAESDLSKLIVIVNDNEMSIGQSAGGLARNLTKMRTGKRYLDFKKSLKKSLQGTSVGDNLYARMDHLKDSLRNMMVPGGIFEQLGFKYFGPIDGHNIHDLVEILSFAKVLDVPVVIHVVTKKGKGYVNAEKNPDKFHGIGPFDPTTGTLLASSNAPTYSSLFGEKLTELAEKDPRIMAISAAMISGTGLTSFENNFPERTWDAGIAEQHAVDLAAGFALGGQRPVVAIYSTFLQRAYDQILMDVCLQNLPVVFAIDRAGNVGNDGPTHHGLFDLSYLSHMPNMTIMMPSDGWELQNMLEFALTLDGPSAIRYPRSKVPPMTREMRQPLELGKARQALEGSDVTIFAAGALFGPAMEAALNLEKKGISVDLWDPRFATPLDKEAILASAKKTGMVVTIEDNVIPGGFGMAVTAVLTDKLPETRILRLGFDCEFIEQGSRDQLFALHGLDAKGIEERVEKFLEKRKA